MRCAAHDSDTPYRRAPDVFRVVCSTVVLMYRHQRFRLTGGLFAAAVYLATLSSIEHVVVCLFVCFTLSAHCPHHERLLDTAASPACALQNMEHVKNSTTQKEEKKTTEYRCW